MQGDLYCSIIWTSQHLESTEYYAVAKKKKKNEVLVDLGFPGSANGKELDCQWKKTSKT